MQPPRPYQLNYSDTAPLMTDEVSRRTKARKMIAILKDAFAGETLAALRLLDVGSSAGIITSELAKEFGCVTGIDIDLNGLLRARSYIGTANQTLVLGDAMNLPFATGSFDVVVLNHIYEHVPDPGRLIEESWRILKPGRLAYFAAYNRFAPIEIHYQLPFLSWLPRRLANLYLRISRKGRGYYEDLLSLPTLRRLVEPFEIDDYTMRVIREPDRFEAGDLLRVGSPSRLIPPGIVAAFAFFLPTYLWILRKRA